MLKILCVLMSVLPSIASAQTFPTIPPSTVVGRTAIGPGPAQAIPFATLPNILFPVTTVIGDASKFWSPVWSIPGNPTVYQGTGVTTKFNRLQVGAETLASTGLNYQSPYQTTGTWVANYLDTMASGTIAATSALGLNTIIAATRTSDSRFWTGASSGGSQAFTSIAVNDDQVGGAVACGICGLVFQDSSLGISVNQFDINSSFATLVPTPFGGVIGSTSWATLMTPGAYPFATQHISGAIAIAGGNGTTRFHKGIVVMDGGLSTAQGAGGNGVWAEVARNMSFRVLNSGHTVDAELWGNASGWVTTQNFNGAGIILTNNLQVGGATGLGTAPTATSWVSFAASTTGASNFNLPATGVAPSSPNNGDVWFDGTSLFMRTGGVSQPFAAFTAATNGGLVIPAYASVGTKIRAAGTAPALTSCGGGSPTISGSDLAGEVTMGTTASGCVITFNVAYSSTPYCTVTWPAQALASQSYAVSTTAITLTQTSTSGNKVYYVCMARSAG